jgi:hypothetical protein
MVGYVRRKGPSTGVLDPLFVRALVLRCGGCTLALVVADVLLFSSRWAAKLRANLARALGVGASQVILAATHTHSGPLIDTAPFDFAPLNSVPARPSYLHFLERRMEEAVYRAALGLQPVEAAFAQVAVRGVASDRNRRRNFRSQPLYLLRLAGPSATAVLGVYGCHSTVLGYASTRFSGDLLGRLTGRLEARGSFALVGCGGAANISTRFTRRGQTARELQRLSNLAARHAKGARFKPLDVGTLTVREERLSLALRKLPASRTKSIKASGRLAEAAEEADENLRRLRHTEKSARRRAVATLTQIRLGKISLIALPFEMGLGTGEFFWRRARAIPLCYANGYEGYIPPASASPNDYEVISSPFPCQADGHLRRAALKLASRS